MWQDCLNIGWIVCVGYSVSNSPYERKCRVVDYAANILLPDSVVYVCMLYPWRWPHGWPKHVVVKRVYKLSLVHLCVFVGAIIVYAILLFVCRILTLYKLFCLGPTVFVSFILHLGHCATSRKVAGPILFGVTGIFHWHNPSGQTMVLASPLPLIEMRTRNIS